MKISKLFHWLYAFLMFLPIVLFIPNAFYYGFNEHATAQDRTEQEAIYYDTNEVSVSSDLLTDNAYIWNDNYSTSLTSNIDVFSITVDKDTFDLLFPNYNFEDMTQLRLGVFQTHGNLKLYINGNWDYNLNINNINFRFIYGSSYNQNDLANDMAQHILPCYDLVKEYQPIVYSMSISDSMYQAWQSTWNLPFLQWTHTSFVAQPFTYITGLFGVPSDSTLNYIFAYFVSISICWLVFDLLMYVPNLAHRWLDRSALE